MQKIHFFTLSEPGIQPSARNAGGAGNRLVVVGSTETLQKRHFVKVNESVFVNEIKKRPILYNVLHKDYKRITVRNEAWSDVATVMNLSVQECKKRWRSMRDAFLKTLRNKGEEERKTWIHYRLLEFLLPFTRPGFVRGQNKSTTELNECNENSSDFDYITLDNDLDLYADIPVTVSYVTEDGSELFQILHQTDCATLPVGQIVQAEGVGPANGTLTGVIEPDGQLTSLLRPQVPSVGDGQQLTTAEEHLVEALEVDYLVTSDHEEGSESESLLYEERLDSTMLDFCTEIIEPTSVEALAAAEVVWRDDTEQLVQETVEECYESEEEIIEPAPQELIVTHPPRKCRKVEEEVQVAGAIKDEPSETYQLVEAVPLPSPVASPSPSPAASPAPTASPLTLPGVVVHKREEEPRIQGSTELDTRLGITDSDERFLMSCAPLLRRLPNKKNVIARLRIQHLLYELEYDEKYDGV